MSTITKCKFCNPEIEHFNVLRSFLPGDYEYVVCSFDGDNVNFKTRLRTNGRNNTYAHKWLEDFQLHSKCTMRVERTFPHCGTKNVFKIDLRCQHNTRPRSEKSRERESCKNTDCPAKMCITIKRVVTERKSSQFKIIPSKNRSKDPHLPDHPTVIQMDFCHNHAILTPEILKHRSVLPDVKEKILTLFKFGHNPATALDMHKYDLLLEHGENFEKICHDRALLPDPQFCYRLYYKIVRKQGNLTNGEKDDAQNNPTTKLVDKKPLTSLSSFENSSFNSQPNDAFQSATLSQDSLSNNLDKKAKKKRRLESSVMDSKEMSIQLEDLLCKFCESGGFAGMQLIENNTVMALCTPLMHRIHTLVKNSGEIIFIDSYGELEEPNNCRVYLLVTYSCIGAIPVGCLVTTSTETIYFKTALEIWKQILPNGCFYNKKDGPDIFFTHDDETERQCLKEIFPKSQLLICLSHLLQATWTFLSDRKNAIKKDHRSHLFSKVKVILFSQTVEELEMNYAYVINDSLVKSYSCCLDYLNHLYSIRHEWSLVYRNYAITKAATDVSFFWEAAMIVLKDPILSRTRTYNPLQIVDFLSRIDTYYERKLIDLANSRFDSVRLSRFLFIELPREAYTITQNSENEYEVHNDTKDTTYQVDITLGMCECRTGKSGAPCKHQLLVFRNFPVPIYDCIPPNTVEEKNSLLHLATGQEIESVRATDLITKAVESAMTEPEILPDLETCGENDFFLEDNASCETMVQNSALSHPSVLNEPNSSLSLQSGSLIETAVLDHHHHNSSINSQDVTIPQHSLLSQLADSNHQTISLSHPVNSQLSQQLVNIEENISHLPHRSTEAMVVPPPPPPPSCPSVSNLQSDEQAVTELLNQIFLKLKERTMASPQIFKPALGTFLKNLNNLSADSSLEYALYSFGKFSKSASPLFKRKIVNNKLIGFQSIGDLKKKKLSLQTHKSSATKKQL